MKKNWSNYARDFPQKSREIFTDLRQYHAIVSNVNGKEGNIFKIFNDQIYQIFKDINRDYTDIINKKIFD